MGKWPEQRSTHMLLLDTVTVTVSESEGSDEMNETKWRASSVVQSGYVSGKHPGNECEFVVWLRQYWGRLPLESNTDQFKSWNVTSK